MHADFWQQCWDQGQARFHLRCTNPNLPHYWPHELFAPGDTIFVPLCGKSVDLLWFAEQGWNVLAIELIETAVQAFFTENNLSYSCVQQGDFVEYVSGSIRVLCGDFFKLSAADLADCRGFYDRAALVSWQGEGQAQYASHLARILPAGCHGLMLVVDYEQEQMPGPPFAISTAAMQALLGHECSISQLGQRDILRYEPGFKARGVTRMDEHIYAVVKRPQQAAAG